MDEVESEFSAKELVSLASSMTLSRLKNSMRSHRSVLTSTFAISDSNRPVELKRMAEEIPRKRRVDIERSVSEIKLEFQKELERVAEEMVKDDPQAQGTAYPLQPEHIVIFALATTGPKKLRDLMAKIFAAAENVPSQVRYALSYLQWIGEEPTVEQLGRALLPMVVADFESFLSSILRLWLLLYPKSLGVGSKMASVAEVMDMRSSDDFLAFQFEETVRSIINEGHRKWDKVFTSEIGIPMASLTDAWPNIVEGLARRNAVIHSAGRVDRQYLEQAALKDSQPALGTPLKCDSAYMKTIIDSVERLSSVLTVEIVCLLAERSEHVVGIAEEEVFQALVKENWADAHRMASSALKFADKNESVGELRVNFWMASRQLNANWQKLLDDVQEWQPDKGSRFEIARAALLDHEDEALESIKSFVNNGHALTEITKWPLMVQMRKDSPVVDKALSRNWSSNSPPKPKPTAKRRGRRR